MGNIIAVFFLVSCLMTVLSVIEYNEKTYNRTPVYLIFSVVNLIVITCETYYLCNGKFSAFSAFPNEDFSPDLFFFLIILKGIMFLLLLISLLRAIKSKDRDMDSFLDIFALMLLFIIIPFNVKFMMDEVPRWKSILNWGTSERYEQIKICPEIENFATYEFSLEQLKEVRLGLESKVDVSIYADLKFDWQQMHEIRLGLEKGLNARFYADPKFDHKQMRELRLGLEYGININQYADPNMDWHEMYMKRMSLTQNEGEKDVLYTESK